MMLRKCAGFWFFCFVLLLGFAPIAQAEHGYALWGDLKYPAGFDHFSYVNVDAPKGGDLVMVSNSRISNFDTYNPFARVGTAPAYIKNLVFETLLTNAMDEQGAAYGLLADDVEVAPDKKWVRFHLNSKAKFNNGDPVLAEDVLHSYKMLMSDDASPGYQTMLHGVTGVRIGEDDRTVYFDISDFNRELPLNIGGLPIFSHKWGQGKTFGEIKFDEPMTSGPYKIGKVSGGRDITYARNPNYWGQNLNVMKGQNNFDQITVRIYLDATAKLEGFKAGEFDFMQEFSANNWERQYRGKRFESGEIVKKIFPHKMPAGFQGYILNTRNRQYIDARVRKALNLAYDFEWMSRTMFYGSYARLSSYFQNTDYEATGLPSEQELALLLPLQAKYGKVYLPDEVLYEPAPLQPTTDAPNSLRENLKQARDLLREAGWTYRDGALRNAQGEPFVVNYLDSKESSTYVHAAWVRALGILGIKVNFRTVDFSLYQELLNQYELDVVTLALPGSALPGSELNELYSSTAADTTYSANWWGIKNPVVDALIEQLVSAQDKTAAVAAGRALDRMLRHGSYSILQFYSPGYRVAYDASKLAVPDVIPPYYSVEGWVMGTWWDKHAQANSSKGEH